MLPYKKLLPYLLLFLAFALRVWQLTAIPPGLTHDEAAHGHDAAYILKGVTLIYFPVGYGREPLFDYFNAGLMAGLGISPFALRFSAVIFGILTLAATHRVARTLFGWETATLALALMGASFWPLATGRQILRSAMLPLEIALAVMFFLKLNNSRTRRKTEYLLLITGFTLAIAASLYTYIPARVLWLIFPLTLLTRYVLRLTNPLLPTPNFRSLLALPLAFLLASPLFIYLYQNPEAEQRIGTLSAPLTALQNGDASLILNNAIAFALAFFWPGHGDQFLAYNIPGQPIFDPITFILFIVGLILILKPHAINISTPHSTLPTLHSPLLFVWLFLGLAPSFITGPEALTTRIIGAQPVLYIVAAIPLTQLIPVLLKYKYGDISKKLYPQTYRIPTKAVLLILYTAFIGLLGIVTANDYLVRWGQSPDVRAAYQSTAVEMLKAVNGPAVISSVYPGVAHNPYIGELITTQETRWVDARYAVILRAPNNSTEPSSLQLLAPASTPIHPYLANFYRQRLKVTLRPDDLDPFFIFYQPLTFRDTSTGIDSSIFKDAVVQRGGRWLADTYKPGDVAELITAWEVIDSSQLGPLYPPAFKTDLNLFTHVLNPDGSIFLQQDRLDAPSWQWQTGDAILQIHQFAIPADATAGEYQVKVGVYDRVTGERLLTQAGADHVTVSPLIIR